MSFNGPAQPSLPQQQGIPTSILAADEGPWHWAKDSRNVLPPHGKEALGVTRAVPNPGTIAPSPAGRQDTSVTCRTLEILPPFIGTTWRMRGLKGLRSRVKILPSDTAL